MRHYNSRDIFELSKLIRDELYHCLWGQEYDGTMETWEFPIKIKVAQPYKKDSKVYSDIEYEFLENKLHFTSQWAEPWDGFKEANPEWKPNFSVTGTAIEMAKTIAKIINEENTKE